MSSGFVSFDKARNAIVETLAGEGVPDGVDRLYLVRNMFGKVRISVSEKFEDAPAARSALSTLAVKVGEAAGRHGYGADDTDVLFVSDDMLDTLDGSTCPVAGADRAYWAERLVTEGDWWTVDRRRADRRARRWTLFSVMGGLGRSAASAVLAWDLAGRGERVLVVDLNLESPDLSSTALSADARPVFGVTDWFVEELVGQGDHAIERMTGEPEWARNLEGKAWVAPAHGADPGEYLAKLGRVHMDSRDYPWTARLRRMLDRLEAAHSPTVVLIDSRAGFHDIAAAAVTGVDADVLLFAVDTESCWTNYGILFRHWREKRLADAIRDRLEVVSALTPRDDRNKYLRRFQRRAWRLFAHNLYGIADPPPHFKTARRAPVTLRAPLATYRSNSLAAGMSMDRPDTDALEEAYGAFLSRFDPARIAPGGEGTG